MPTNPRLAPTLVVLVVDSERSSSASLGELLQHAGYTVYAVMSARAAADVLRSVHVDLLVLDVLLPDLRGDVLYTLAGAYQPHLTASTIFLTGDLTPTTRAAVENTGCPQIDRPVEEQTLLTMLNQLAARTAPVPH